MADFNVDRFKEEASLEGISNEQIDLVLREEGLLSEELEVIDTPPLGQEQDVVLDTPSLDQDVVLDTPSLDQDVVLDTPSLDQEQQTPKDSDSNTIQLDLSIPDLREITDKSSFPIGTGEGVQDPIGFDISGEDFLSKQLAVKESLDSEGFFNSPQATIDLDDFNAINAEAMVGFGFRVGKELPSGMTIFPNHPQFLRVYEGSELFTWDDEGNKQDIDSGFINSMIAQKSEVLGSLAGAGAGIRLGQVGGALVGGFLGKSPSGVEAGRKVGGLVGGLVGGALGSGLGKSFDMMVGSLNLKIKISNEDALRKIRQAGLEDALLTVVGGTALKLGGKLSKFLVKDVIGGTLKAFLANKSLAVKTLTNKMGISNKKAQEIYDEWFALLKPSNKAITEEQKIQALLSRGVRTQNILSGIVGGDNKFLKKILEISSKRAEVIINASQSLTNSKSFINFLDDIRIYKNDVKAKFSNSSSEAINLMRQSNPDYSFNADKLLGDPLMNQLKSTITNPDSAKTLTEGITGIIEQIKNNQFTRFEDLMSLRRVVNQIDAGEVGDVLVDKTRGEIVSLIDKEIASATKNIKVGNNKLSDILLEDRIAYGDMSIINRSSMQRALLDASNLPKKESEEAIGDIVFKAFKDNNSDFTTVVQRLPKNSRKSIDRALFNKVVQDNSATIEGGNVVNFIQLDKNLENLNFLDFRTKKLRGVIKGLSKVFEDDEAFASLSGSVIKPSRAGGFITDVESRAKANAVVKIFEIILQFTPTELGRTSNMSRRIAEVIQNPTSQKSLNRFVKGFNFEQRNATEETIKKYAAVLAKEAASGKAKPPTKQFFTSKAIGTEFDITSGVYGKGNYFRTNNTGKLLKTGYNLLTREIPTSRIADGEVLRDLFPSLNGKSKKEVAAFLRKSEKRVTEDLMARGYKVLDFNGIGKFFE